MKQPEIYSLPPEMGQLLGEVLVAAARAHRKLSAELKRRGIAVKPAPELEACLRQIEHTREQHDD